MNYKKFAIILFLMILLASIFIVFFGFKRKAAMISSGFKNLPILEYHLIERPEGRWRRSPENFKRDLAWLYKNGYYPVNLRDLLTHFKGLPEGKKPVVLTFDDSSLSQFRYLANGKIDSDCAIGMLKAFHEKHPKAWPMRATFFVLIETDNPDRNIFGQPAYAKQKLQQLTKWGMEVGSHTYSHEHLNKISPASARYTLARSYQKLKELSGQEIISLALPMGLYPTDEAVFSGRDQSLKYDYQLVCGVAGGFQVIPYTPRHLKRIQTINSEWIKFFHRYN